MSPRNPVLIAAALFGFTGVAFGAFGAHALRNVLSPQALDWWRTGVDYHLVHAVALLGLSFLPTEGKLQKVSFWAFSAGIVLFSGSLYTMAITGATSIGWVTPLGGVSFLTGWASLLLLGWRKRS